MTRTRDCSVHVLHLISGDVWGGAEEVIHQLVKHTSAQPGFKISAVVLNEGELAAKLRALSIRTTVIEESKHRLVGLWREIRRSDLLCEADLVHVHRYKEAVLAAAAVDHRAQRLLFTVHGLQPMRQLRTRDLIITWSGLLATRCRGGSFVAVSRDLERRLSSALGRERVFWIPNPASMPPESPLHNELKELARQKGLRSIVGFVGRLEHVKGPDLFLDTARLCPDDVLFAILGEGSMRTSLNERVRSLGLQGRVVFLGHVPDVGAHLGQLDVVVMSSRHEGLPMVAIEAALYGIPLAAFAVGGVPELVANCAGARLVPQGDVDGLARAISDLLQDRGAKEQARSWGASLRHRLDPVEIGKRYCDLYQTVMGPASRRRDRLG